MISARFFLAGEQYTGCEISGHADYSEEGTDVICAYVSATVQTVANLMTEIFRLPRFGGGTGRTGIGFDTAERTGSVRKCSAAVCRSGIAAGGIVQGLSCEYPSHTHGGVRKC